MICPHCRAENREGRRFCAGCGGSLSVACSTCGFQNEPQERFCGGCGAAMAAKPKPDGAAQLPPAAARPASADRRPVTVMFVDLSGYTALSATLDPEDMNRLLQRFFEVVDGLVINFGGTIDKHIGDNVMALFGAPVAHGNDPERAIRAAVAIQAAMPSLGSDFGRELTVHIGLALGEVVASGLGSAAHTAYTVTGDAANLAARLMGIAASGETLVAEALCRTTERLAVFEKTDITQLKGLAKPQAIYRLAGLKTGRAAEPAIVGRQNELAQLVAILNASRESGQGASAAIRADPGIGKSRLVREFKAQAAAQGFTCVSGQILDFGGLAGQDVVAAITAGLLDIPLAAASQIKAECIANAVNAGRIDQKDRPFAHDLLGLSQLPGNQAVHAATDAKARQRGMAATLAKLLQTASRDKPVLVAIEDVHWANQTTLHLLAQLAAAATQCAAVIVMTTRFDGDPFDATWRAQSSGGLAVTIDLKPLGPKDATMLASGVIAEVDDFARQCIARAEGNPLFLEQLLRSRLADGDGKLPHSLQGVVLARLDSLAELDRHALQAASVLGQRFAEDDLRAMLGAADYDCQTIVNRQLLKPEGDSYMFAHALIRDGVYASLMRDARRGLHLRAAGLYAARDPVLRAEHLERAEDAAAAQAFLIAAETEAASHRLENANALASRGLELARQEVDIVKLGLCAGRLRLATGLAKPARDAYEAAIHAAQNDLDRCRGLVGMAAADRILANLDRAMESLRAAEIIAAAADSPALLSEIHYMRGNLHFARGEGSECFSEHSLALAAAERANEPEWKARALSGLGDSAYLQGRIKTALGHYRNCVKLAGQHGLLRVIPANQCMIGDCMAFQLDFNGALDQIASARELARRIGDRFCEMFTLQGEAFVLFSAGRLAAMEAPAEAALVLAAKLGARRYEALLQTGLAQLRLSQHRVDEARGLLNSAFTIAEDTGQGFCGPLICSAYARLHGASDEGRSWIARGEEMLAQGKLAHNHVFFRREAIDWAIGAGDWPMAERFADELSDLTADEPLSYVDLFVDRTRALCALGRNPDDLQALATMQRVGALAASVNFVLTPQSTAVTVT